MKRRALLLVALGCAAPNVGADQVFLRSGGQLTGVVVERSAKAIVLEVGPGRVSLPMSTVDRVVAGASPLAQYRERAASLAGAGAAAWLELAYWARGEGLTTQAVQAFDHVLTLDPHNHAAHRGRGDVDLGGQWVSLEDSYRARGYVFFEGSWVSPQEREAAMRNANETALLMEGRAEADARAREAEARARVAEAEARRAESAMQGMGGGIPIYGYGATYYGGFVGRAVSSVPQPHHRTGPALLVDPVVTVTRDTGATGSGHTRREGH